MKRPSVLVAGAGPVGVVTCLAALQAGFNVRLVEAADAVLTDPRAATTHPSTLEMIARVGLLDQMIAEGLVCRHFEFWDRPTLRRIASFDHQALASDTPYPFVVQTEQHKLARMGIDRLRALGVEVTFGCRLESFTQDADGVDITLMRGDEPEHVRTDWLIGSDGGRSTVRKQLDVPFEGYTWPERFIVLTVLDDFEKLIGCTYRTYFADPNEWTNLFKVSGDDGLGRWRAVFPTAQDETDEEALSDKGAQQRLQRIFPLDGAYNLVHRNIYRVHQRVAANFRVGRVLLAGDAAHVNNPIGGLGLNFGIHDAIDAVDTLTRVALGGEDAALLDGYTRRRRELNIEFVQQQTIANKKRLEQKDPVARDAELKTLAETAADPQRARAFLLRTSLIESVQRAATIT